MGKKRKRTSRNLKKSSLVGKRILAWCDSPRVATGFGNVAREILTRLAREGALIDIIAINDLGGWYDTTVYPFRIYPAMPGASPSRDFYGRAVLYQALTNTHPALRGPWDLIWVLNDHFILEQHGPPPFDRGVARFIEAIVSEWKKKGFEMKTVVYTPVDSMVKENWVIDGLLPFDSIVTYTEYGKRELLKAVSPLRFEERKELERKLRVIPHGVDTNIFRPLPKDKVEQFKREVFMKDGWLKPEDFLIVNVNRNQPRKDIPRTMMIFREFQKRVPDSKLYLHMAVQDAGGNLVEVARILNIDFKLIRAPKSWDASSPYPPEYLSFIYNSADVVINTHLGEGWGLPIFEAMACGRPVLTHNITSTAEILGIPEQKELREGKLPLPPEDSWRGLGIRSKDWVYLGREDLERIRPTADVEDAVEKLIWIYENEKEALEMGKRASEFCSKLTWDKVGKMWISLLTSLDIF